jgi:hypothetical protein
VAGKAESIDAYSGARDWDTPFRDTPDSAVGEVGHPRRNAVVADRTALTFSETSRTPYDGDTSRSQGKFPTTNGGKTS